MFNDFSTKLAINNVSVREVTEAVRRHNFEEAGGQLKTADREYTVTIMSNLEKPVQFEEMAVIERDGRIIKMKDLGHVEMMPEERQTKAYFNGQRVISIGILKQGLANPMDIANAVKNKLPELRKKLKADMSLDISFDDTKYIDVAVKQVYRTIAEAILFVTFVVLVFLTSLRASLIPLVTIPVSLVGTFFFVYLLGFTINTFSLAAMVLAVGLVVDDAIVVLENSYRYLEKGLSPFVAASQSINEIGFSVIAMTLTLAAVYAPTALAQGLTGKLMIEFSITLAISVLISGFVALTLSPMMCARMLANQKLTLPEQKLIGWLEKNIKIEERLTKLDHLYENLLRKVLSMKKNLLIGVVILGSFCFFLYNYIPKNLLPTQDKNTIIIDGEAPQSATLEFTDKYVKLLDEKLSKIPDIEKKDAKIDNITHYKIQITLKDRKKKSTSQIIKDISKIYDSIPGINARISTEDQSQIIQFAVRGNKDIEQLQNYMGLIHQNLGSSGLFQPGTLSTQRHKQEEYIIKIDEKVDALKTDPRAIADMIKSLMKGEKSTEFKKENRRYDVIVEVDQKFKKTIYDYLKIYVKTHNRNEETRIPLSELIKIESTMGYPNVLHYKKTRMVDAIYKLNAGVGLKECIKKIESVSKKVLPDDVYLEFIGKTKEFIEEGYWMVFIFALSICFIYLVLAAQFESWRDPFIIILTVPLSLAGGILGLLLLLKDPNLTLWGNIGFITLIGLITKHGIMMVDFANKLLEKNYTPTQAILEASKIRLRPILMTTSAMVLGTIPLLLAHGPTEKANNELGAVIVGGLIVGTLLTLFVIPSVYIIFKNPKTQSIDDVQ